MGDNKVDKQRLMKLRGLVIDQMINLETMISAIICQHYFNRVRKDFLLEMLYDEQFTFALKRRIFEKIINKTPSDLNEQSMRDIYRLNTIRNLFAHCGIEIISPPTPLSSDRRRRIPNPRAVDKELDFESLYAEFTRKGSAVSNYLQKLLIKSGVTLTKGRINLG